MKKLLSLFMTFSMLFYVVCMTPAVSAEETPYTVIDKEWAARYWEEIYDTKTIVQSGDWYYTCSSDPSLDKARIGVCGYKGNETDITVPKEFLGKEVTYIEDFYFISNTVKTVRIQKEITSITLPYYTDEEEEYNNVVYGAVFEGASPLEAIIVDSENENYASEDGVLFTKNFSRLVYYPTHKSIEKYVVPSMVKYITRGAFANVQNLKSLTITTNVTELGYDSIPKNSLDELYFENVQLPEYVWYLADVPSEDRIYPKYVPDVPNTVVYCVEGSSLYKIYEQSFEEPEGMCKELKALPQFTETLKKEADGKWYYYNNEYKVYNSTLVKYKGKWFYVSNGVWDKTVTDKIIKYKDKWFYIKNGKWNSSTNTLVKIDGEWLGIVNGKWDTSIKTLIKYKGKWFYIKNGKWCRDTAIVKYKGKRFYVKNGKVDFDYSGSKKIDGKTYKIKNGKVA